MSFNDDKTEVNPESESRSEPIEINNNEKLIGVISDTHNNIDETKEALNFFKSKNIHTIVHCGDLTSPDMVLLFKDFRFFLSLGNGDRSFNEISENIKKINGKMFSVFGFFEFNGIRIAVTHGHHKAILDKLIKSSDFDLVLTGHTHRIRYDVINDDNGKSKVIVNPGAHNPRNTRDLNRDVGLIEINNQDENKKRISVRFYNLLYKKYINLEQNLF
ncbi:MAG: YfcE family phosphodiesterase [Nitrospiraceae bacterium]|nr:YfcE family phosphodiesterase [Nitrospiraceae bacterium]